MEGVVSGAGKLLIPWPGLSHPDRLKHCPEQAGREEVQTKSKVCANVFCGAGRECAVTEKGEPSCLAVSPQAFSVLAASTVRHTATTVSSHETHVSLASRSMVAHDGHCQDRNELRHHVIQWLQTEVVPDGWFVKGSNFTEILLKYFKNYDNGDSQMDSSELLKFIQHNDSNVGMQSLCVDALIELSDENTDWKLSFDEFLNCLKPGFNPPEKKCALEDETYEDGAETQVECNRCVCACGNWVCTAMTCTDKTAVVEETGEAGQEMTEEEWSLRVAELNKHQETVEKMKASTKEA
ncbi:unnamed protein product [Coregonus sp. 'balchen']|nr:unnamed protein product [Coregonus sp. 'balchen']